MHELPITTNNMKLVQVLFPHTIVRDGEILETEESLMAHELEKP
jgi:hypothetical protein